MAATYATISSRRRPVTACATALTLGALVVLVGLAAGDRQAAAQDDPTTAGGGRPNVVVVMTDDQDVRSLRVMAAVRQKLVSEGTTFDRFFATFPLCCPSRATFLTGKYAHNHGLLSNSGPNGGYENFNDRQTLPVWLRRDGYRTGYIGKYLNGYGGRGNNPREVPRGWDQWYGKVDGGMFNYTLNQNGRLKNYGDRPRLYQTDVFARKAIGFIKEQARRQAPFFLTVATSAPHTEGREPPRPAPRHRGRFNNEPLPSPPSYNERDVSDKPSFVRGRGLIRGRKERELKRKFRGRLASLLAVDDAVATIVRRLRRVHELDDTVVIFTSDNGYLLGEHRLTRKTLLYEESVQVPLIARGPGFPAGVDRGQIAGNIDLAPTILDLANAQPRGGGPLDGISLRPLAADGANNVDRDILLENSESSAVRTPRYMYAEHPGGERELYDLSEDPFQLRSIHRGGPHEEPTSGTLQQELSDRLRQLERCAGAECR